MITELNALIGKEIKQTVRDRKMLFLLIFAPVIQLSILGFAVDLEVDHVRTVVADEDRTAASRELAQGLLAGTTFDLVGHVPHGEDAAGVIARGDASIALIIPPGYGRALSEGRPADVQVLVDGADSIQGVVSQNAVAAYLAEKSVALMMARLAERSALAAMLAQSSATGATAAGDDGVSGAVTRLSAGPTATASGPSPQPVRAPVNSSGVSWAASSAMAAAAIPAPSGQPSRRPASPARATPSASSLLESTEMASPPPSPGLLGSAESPTPPAQIDLVRVEPRTFYNPSLDSQLHFVPGIAAILLLVVTLIVTALGLSREDEAGTLEQVLVTPMTPTTLVLGKTLPYALIGLVDLLLVIAAGAVVFDVPIRGRLWLLLLAGILYMLTTLGIGLLAGTLAKSQQQAFFNAAFFLMPAMILSGFLNPIESMPEWLQPVTAFDPVRHFVEILRAVLLKGSTLKDLAHSYVALAGMGLATFWLAGWALRRKLR